MWRGQWRDILSLGRTKQGRICLFGGCKINPSPGSLVGSTSIDSSEDKNNRPYLSHREMNQGIPSWSETDNSLIRDDDPALYRRWFVPLDPSSTVLNTTNTYKGQLPRRTSYDVCQRGKGIGPGPICTRGVVICIERTLLVKHKVWSQLKWPCWVQIKM